MRKIIVHYHIFKNAGTSIDEILKKSFGSEWMNFDENPVEGCILPKKIEEVILKNPDLKAISSHLLVPPLPNQTLEVFPIVILRHPIDRAYSAYLFEWQKQAGTDAPKGSFDEFIDSKLQYKNKNAIQNYQTFHLANTSYEKLNIFDKEISEEETLERAKIFVDTLPCIGFVEHYSEYLKQLALRFGPHFPKLDIMEYHLNMLQSNEKNIYQKLNEIKKLCSKEHYEKLVLANILDLRLYEYAQAVSKLTSRSNKSATSFLSRIFSSSRSL